MHLASEELLRRVTKHLKLNLHACSCFTGLEKCGYDTVIKKQMHTYYNHCLTAKKTVLQNYQQNCPEAKFLNTEETCALKIAQASFSLLSTT